MMGWVAALAVGVLSGFEVQSLPLPEDDPEVFLVRESTPGKRLFVVQDGRDLRAYPLHGGPVLRASLPDGVRAYDLADFDGDGQTEILTTDGERVRSIGWTGGSDRDEIQELFTAPADLPSHFGMPYRYPLAFVRDGSIFLGLRHNRALGLWSRDGEQVGRYPESVSGSAFDLTESFHLSVSSSRPVESGGELAFTVGRFTAFEPVLPEDLRPADAVRALAPAPTPTVADVVEYDDPERWPWFVVRRGDGTLVRAYYSRSPRRDPETLIALRSLSAEDDLNPLGEVTAPLRYPGLLVLSADEAPDFNGDGFGDLLLWQADQPTGSVDSVVRTLSAGTWPVRLTVHLYSPESGRFEPRAHTSRAYRQSIDLLYAVQEGPGWLIARDFNGDGRADLALAGAQARNTLSIWLWGKPGLSGDADFSHRFDDPIERIRFVEDIEDAGRYSLGIETKGRLHVVRYTDDP